MHHDNAAVQLGLRCGLPSVHMLQSALREGQEANVGSNKVRLATVLIVCFSAFFLLTWCFKDTSPS